MSYQFDWSSIPRAWPYLVEGLATTGGLVAASITAGIALGTVLAIGRLFGPRPVTMTVAAYVNVFRSIPLILTIFWFFFLVPAMLRAVTGDPYLTVGPIDRKSVV